MARVGNKYGWHSGTLKCKKIECLGDLEIQDDIVFTDVSAGALGVTGGIDMSGIAATETGSCIILGGNGRISTGSSAGTALDIDATYFQYGEGLEFRWAVTDWADTYTLTSFKGMYLRAENQESNNAASIYGMEIYGVSNNVANTNYIWGALIYAYVKGAAGLTAAGVYALQPEITFDAATASSTITDACVVRAKVTGGTMSDYTVLDGFRLTLGDMNGGSRTYGNGLLLEDDGDMSGTSSLTTGININIGCTTGIDIVGTCTEGIDLNDGCTTGIDIGAVTDGISFTGAIGGSGIDFTSCTPETAAADDSCIRIGGYTNALTLSAAITANTFMQSIHVDSQVNPGSSMWLVGSYNKIKISTADQANTNAVPVMIRADIGKPIASFYGIQSHLSFSGTGDCSAETIGISAQLYGTAATGTGYHWGVKSDLRHAGCPSGAGHTSACFFGVGTVDISCGLYLEALTSKTMYSGIYLHAAGNVTNAIELNGCGNMSYLIRANAEAGCIDGTNGTYSTADGFFKAKVAGNDVRIPFYNAVD